MGFDNNMQQIRHWIFDMDGTLTDSAHDFVHIRAELGLSGSEPILEALHAMPKDQSLPLWRRLDELELYYADRATRKAGAIELLENLSQKNSQLATLTRNTMPVVHHTLQACGISGYFPDEHIFDRDRCEPKPSPQGILQLLDLWQIRPQQAVMVGDFLYDLQAGRAAGVTTIHIDNSKGDDHWPEYTDVRVHSLHHLLDHLH